MAPARKAIMVTVHNEDRKAFEKSADETGLSMGHLARLCFQDSLSRIVAEILSTGVIPPDPLAKGIGLKTKKDLPAPVPLTTSEEPPALAGFLATGAFVHSQDDSEPEAEPEPQRQERVAEESEVPAEVVPEQLPPARRRRRRG